MPRIWCRSGTDSTMIFWSQVQDLVSFITLEQFEAFFFLNCSSFSDLENGKMSSLGSFSAVVATPFEV